MSPATRIYGATVSLATLVFACRSLVLLLEIRG